MLRSVGSSLPRHDATAKVAGTAAYPDDINVDNQVWMKIVFAGMPHARINFVDISQAMRMPGVIDVITASDVPNNEYGLLIPDQPVLCGSGSTPKANKVRWEADKIALVIAATRSQAEAAAKKIHIDYSLLPVVSDPIAALEPDSPLIDDERGSNLLYEYHFRRGDVYEAMADADVVVESVYRTHAQEHAYLQPESGVSFMRKDGRIEVIAAGQWMHEEREQIAHVLGVPTEQIVVRHPAIGGAFGGREDLTIQIPLALAALITGRAVKTTWSREESIVGHHKRHPFIIEARWGATNEGKIIAAEAVVTSDAGGYMYTSSKVLGNAALGCLGPYEIPAIQVHARAALTNNCPGGAFRGFGAPQAHFAAEMQVAKLAAALNMDPVDLRMKNILRDGSVLPTRSIVPKSCTAAIVTAEAARLGGWIENDNQEWHRPGRDRNTASIDRMFAGTGHQTSLDASRTRTARGIGLATCYKNVGFSFGFPEHCYATIELFGEGRIERAVVGCVGAEVGQGAHMAFRQLAAAMLELDIEQVSLLAEHTDITGSSGSASASRMTFMAGNAIQGAVRGALKEWQNEERPARFEYVYRPRQTSAPDRETGESDPSITYGYCAQLAEIAIDLDTGHLTVERLVSVNDVGKAVNPQLVEGQIEGAAAQAIGWALLEQYLQREGKTITPHLSNYLIPGVLDVAQVIEPVILEIPDPQGPMGVRGMAEMAMIPTAPAIAAAIHDAVGLWIDELPFTPERLWNALNK